MKFNILPAYAYDLPEELIATTPAEPRDSSRLFVYDTASGDIVFDTFNNLSRYVGKEHVLVFNKTKVVPARITLLRGEDEIGALLLLNEHTEGEDVVRAIVNKHIRIGERLNLAGKEFFEVIAQDENVFTFRLLAGFDALKALLEKEGETPIPGYLKDMPLSEAELRGRYQTMFADTGASVATPTASLHFTPEVIASLETAGVSMEYIALHVGLGTFMTVYPEQLEKGELHEEPFEISEQVVRGIQESKQYGKKVVAVGTTVARALESNAEKILHGHPRGLSGRTNIFIKPPYTFQVADSMITNFHVPQSSLMCMIDAFLQSKGAKHSLLELYEIAIKERFRFFSFGDSMLIT